MKFHSKIIIVGDIMFLIVFALGLWLYTHPIVKTLSLVSHSVNEAKQKGTFICNYDVKETKLLNGRLSADSFPVICQSFGEYYHCRENYESTSIVMIDSEAWVTLIMKNDEDKYEDLDLDEFRGRYPIYRKLYEPPLPDSISIIITRDSLKFLYILERQ